MTTFKCKMCGGALEINSNKTVVTCEYCGSSQTLPKLDDEKRANLYDRANHFRRNNEFDKAAGIYEQILNEEGTDAEAYWSLVLCRYGIEYVEDPFSHKRVSTINRTQYTSIFDDDNYKSALEYADSYQKTIYEAEAKAINEIHKGILAISQGEEPFDVFICYKETDDNGRRTPDSVLANDLYHQLTQEGFKVFFARITLEDKLGTAYEPYIFAALNSAKVMVVLGTKPEHFNAVWVKNEWSRYLALIKNGAKKMLIPAYKDMVPYDLPEEFSHLQAQDMSKLGFMQDLIRGIKKIVVNDKPKTDVKETVVVNNSGNANIAPLLKRAFMFLEDGNWNEADNYCEKVLDIEPENAEAYLGKLMASLCVKKQEELKEQDETFDDDINFQKVIRFADTKLKNELNGYIEHINIRNENVRLNSIYSSAKIMMFDASNESDYEEAARLFETISEYQDSTALITECYGKAEIARKNSLLTKGIVKMTGETIANYEAAIEFFEQISGWKDADEKIYACQRKIEEIKAKQEEERLERERKAEEERKEAERKEKRNKKIAIITTPIACVSVVFVFLLFTVIVPNNKYNNALELMKASKYKEAISVFSEIENHKDSKEKILNCEYNYAIELLDTNVIEAYETLMLLEDYKDSVEKANSIYEEYKIEKLKVANIGDYVYFGTYEQDNNTSNGKEEIEWLVLDKQDNRVLLLSKYVLDAREYHSLDWTKKVMWIGSELEVWLNADFHDSAFTQEESTLISINPETNDRIFLLSVDEVENYLSTSTEKQCKATEYASSKDEYMIEENGKCQWTLRNYGRPNHMHSYVSEYGAVYQDAHNHGAMEGIRPAMWIELND